MRELKAETRTMHERVENLFAISTRVQSRTAYEAVLARLYGLYQPLEAALLATPRRGDLNIDLAARQKSSRLVTDLRALGWDSTQIDALPQCKSLPTLDGPARAAGCSYVLEGATLGGQMICGEVERSLGLHGDGVRFFTGYGERTREHWLAFGSAVTDYSQRHPSETELMVDAAKATFLCFESWLQGDVRC